MSNELAPQETTLTIGYYNGNPYPLQLVVSRYNLQMLLQPKQFIETSDKRKVNDPYFDSFKQLSKEVGTKPVPVLRVPVAGAVVATTQPGQSSVREVTEFTVVRGVRTPVMPKPLAAQVMPEANAASHVAMSMDEARARGFVGKPRLVPEDYGVTDTEGRVTHGGRTPPIKLAMESQPKVRTEAKLPTGLINALPESAGERRALQETLASGHVDTNIVKPTGFLNAAPIQVAAPEPAPAPAKVVPLPAPAKPAPARSSTPKPPPAFAADLVAPMPAPVIAYPEAPEEAMEEEEAIVDEPVATRVEDLLPPPPTEEELEVQPEPPPRKVAPIALPEAVQFTCTACGKAFALAAQLKVHARKFHPDQYAAIMAAYPGV